MSTLNWSECKKFMLDYAQRSNRKRFTRVSKAQVLPFLEASLRTDMRKIVDSQPSVGKTIMLETRKRKKEARE